MNQKTKTYCKSLLAIFLRYKAVPGDTRGRLLLFAYHLHMVSSFHKACVLLFAKAFNCVYTKFK